MWIWLGCLVLCLVVDFFYFPNNTTFPDEQRFLASASGLVQTGQFRVGGGDRAWDMPGPAMFFAVPVYWFGSERAVTAIRVVQALLVALQSAMIFTIAVRVFGDRIVATVAATIAAFYPFFIYYQGLLLSETLFNTFLVAGFAGLYWWRSRGLRIDRAFVVTCVCFAAATMSKATLTLLPPLLLVATAWAARQPPRRLFELSLAASLLYVMLLLPWWIRNYQTFGTFVPFATGSGINFYLGNNPNSADGGISWVTNVEPEVFQRINAIPDELARQQAFVNAAIEYIKRDPAGFLVRMAKKLARFWNVVPNAAAFNSGIYKVISIVTYGPVLLLAIVGAVRLRKRWDMLLPIGLLMAYFTFVHAVTIASLRYRLPLEPFLIVLAAEPLARAGQWLSNAIQVHQEPK